MRAKIASLDLSRLLCQVDPTGGATRIHTRERNERFGDSSLDDKIAHDAQIALQGRGRVKLAYRINNTQRNIGTRLAGMIAFTYGNKGLEPGAIDLTLTGSAGQSFGAFLPPGMTLELEGDSNDYVGKGLSGGKIIIYPSKSSTFLPAENIITGNVALYGATAGEVYIRGMGGERFGVRNSGVNAVIESIGDHGCEYMTGGTVVILGATGRNFAAGMSGGTAYILDLTGEFPNRCNMEMVGLETITDPAEADTLRAMIERHVKYTGSDRGASILKIWEEMIPKFVKVMPKDYKRVLQAMKKASDSGLSGEDAVQAAFEENSRDVARAGGG